MSKNHKQSQVFNAWGKTGQRWMFATQHWLGCEAWRSLSLRFWGTTTWQAWISGTFLDKSKKPLYLHYLINSWDKLMLSQSLKKLEIPFISQAGRHSTQSSWKCPVCFVRYPSTSWSEKNFLDWYQKLSNFDFRQDFMIDLGVGSGLKSQQDRLGCVSASLTQPKVASFMNFLCDSKFV